MKNLLAGLAILSKYDDDAELCAEHDVLYVCVEAVTVSAEDTATLSAMPGWHVTDGHWAMFT